MADQQGQYMPCVVDRRSAERAEWRAACRRQAAVIEAMTNVVGRLRSGVTALKAENAQLRARGDERSERPLEPPDRGASIQAQIALSVHAPAFARRFVTRTLADRVSPAVLERAKLVISELVTSSVSHGRVQESHVTVRTFLTGDHVRLEVQDRGQGGVIAPQPVDAASTAGLALQILQRLSERWGTVCSAAGGTLMWAELSLRPRDAPPGTARP
jgi:anti-sigma regulatory factor (Ser/Thr protein kinase)